MYTVETVQTQTLHNIPRFNISLIVKKKKKKKKKKKRHVYSHTFMDNSNLVQVTLQHQMSS